MYLFERQDTSGQGMDMSPPPPVLSLSEVTIAAYCVLLHKWSSDLATPPSPRAKANRASAEPLGEIYSRNFVPDSET